MNVLLFANVGTAPNKFYHTGDEAMFIRTYEIYHEIFPEYKLYSLTSQRNHIGLRITEYLNLPFPSRPRRYYFTFILKFVVAKLFGYSKFTYLETKFLKLIERQDVVHFCGGGNITSLFPEWLYYSLLIITLSKLLNKKVILTSQTIGPFIKKDVIISSIVLNTVNLLGIRESCPANLKYFVFRPVLKGHIDSAANLVSHPHKILPQKRKIRIGLSLHEWPDSKSKFDNLTKILNRLLRHHNCNIITIPHIYTKNDQEWDVKFMSEFQKQLDLDRKVKITNINYNMIHQLHNSGAAVIKELTSEVDLLISSRYHGIIFALSTNTPVITIKLDDYYRQKNEGALNYYYSDPSKYVLTLEDSDLSRDYQILNRQIKRLEKEKMYLQKKNSSFSSDLFIKKILIDFYQSISLNQK